MRINVPEFKGLESAVSNDFDELLKTLILGESQSLVVRGLEISMATAIGSAASGLQLVVANSAILHSKSNVSGTFYHIESTAPNEILNSAINTKIQGSFTPGTLNYVGIELSRAIDDTTVGPVYQWNPSTNTETTRTLPLAEVLSYKIIISSTSFASNVLPICIVKTTLSNNVESVEDRRPMLFRLGTAGTSTPNPFYSYPWSNDAEGRVENFYNSTSSTSPFKGGDKQIKNMKEFFDAITTSIKEIKGTSYWYTNSPTGSISKLRQDLAHSVISGRGMIVHDAATAGKINWNQDIFINFIGGNLRYKIVANPSTTHITLADNQVAYINLVREVDIVPELTFTNGSTTVSGLSSWTSGLQAGDFVKLAEGDETTYMEIASVLSLTSVQLTTAYAGTTVTKKAQYAYGSYETNATPSTNRHIWVAARSAVPFDQDTYWIFFRSDNGGSVPHVYVRFTETELEQGESQNINDGIPLELLAYVGSPTESDSTPDYADLAPGAKTGTENYNGLNGQNLTERLSYVTSMVADKAQDKTLKYAETYNSIINTTNGTAQELTFIGIGTPTLDIILPSSTNFKNTITLTGTLSLEQNEVAYFTINRNAGFSVANLAALTITTLDLLPLEENVYVFAYRLTDEFCYLYNNRKLKLGGNPVNSGSGVIKVTLHDPVSTTLPLGAVTVDGQSVVNDDRVLFTNLTSGADRIYTALVTAGNVTSWRTEYDFAGFQDPEDGDFVIVQDGTLFADQLGKFNGTEWVFNDKVRYFNGTDFFEQSSLLTSSIANNQSVAADLTTYAFAGSEYSIMEYSISRGSSRETGLAMISTDGVTVAFNQSSATLSATGVTLSADISGANIRIRYTSDNSGSTGTFKFNIRRWSNSAGGPSGVPSYSGGGGGGSVTSSGTPANGEIAFFTTTTDITSNSLLKYSTANQAISLNNLEISTLSTGSILDNQSSPVAVLSYNATSYPFAIIEYSVERGANRRVGRFMVTHDGVTPELGEDFIQKGDTGTTFTADISGGNVRILYTSTNTGTSGTLKFSMRRWA